MIDIDISAIASTGINKCCGPPRPIGGNQPSHSENRAISRNASQKLGMDTPIKVTKRTTWSGQRPFQRAAARPSGMLMTRVVSRARPPSCRVAGR